jgi:hypothetical protein
MEPQKAPEYKPIEPFESRRGLVVAVDVPPVVEVVVVADEGP